MSKLRTFFNEHPSPNLPAHISRNMLPLPHQLMWPPLLGPYSLLLWNLLFFIPLAFQNVPRLYSMPLRKQSTRNIKDSQQDLSKPFASFPDPPSSTIRTSIKRAHIPTLNNSIRPLSFDYTPKSLLVHKSQTIRSWVQNHYWRRSHLQSLTNWNHSSIGSLLLVTTIFSIKN